MANSTSKPMTVRTTDERKEEFKRTYEASGAVSQHDFLGMLLKKFLAPDDIKEIATNPETIETALNLTPEETEEVLKSVFEASEVLTMEEFLDNLIQKFNKPEKVNEAIEETEAVKTPILPNEILLNLSPVQLYAIRETVLTEGFAETQNEIIDSLNPENKPFLYFGNLFEPEIQSLWIRNIVLTDDLPEDEKETAIRHNMAAFLINMFLMHLIEGKISETSVTAKTLITFIQEQDQDSQLKEVV